MRFRLELGFLGEALLGIGLDFGDLGREIAWREIKEEVDKDLLCLFLIAREEERGERRGWHLCP